MADEGVASHYQVLEELGRTHPPPSPPPMLVANLLRLTTGGSFGVVYKAIEKATGEVVAVKHVSHAPPPQLDLS